MLISKPEVLSPVGSPEALEAAVRSGADAVYFGAKHFSARRNAENFNEDELKAAVEYCHIRGVKVYLTLNIMVKQSELADALQTARNAYHAGVDALIISDLGIATVIRKALPKMEIHASTQMSVHSPAALSQLKKLGFSRVVAAREMSREELREFCAEAQKLQIEVEVFVHGALCMCVSGQCLLSSVLGARSGNRGLCAGPCRLPFAASGGTGGTGYDLSLKDLSLIDYIEELAQMGVTSLKIEGRMKRPEYIAAATAACRQAVDNGRAESGILEALGGVFSRSGFTDGYYKAKLGRDMFGIRTKDDVVASKETFSALHALYRGERQSVPVDIRAEITAGKPITLTLSDGTHTAVARGDMPESAQHTATDKSGVENSLLKLGSTPYYPRKVEITLDEGLFVRGALLNELRRTATASLDAARAAYPQRAEQTVTFEFEDTAHKQSPYLIARFESSADIPEDISDLDAIMLPVGSTFPHCEKVLIAETPRYILNENKLLKRLEMLKSQGVEYACCGTLAAIPIARKAGLRVIASMTLNTANSATVNALSTLGTYAVTLSSEIAAVDAVRLPSALPKGIFAYGRLPLMVFRNCPLKNGGECNGCDRKGYLTDRKNIKFPIACRSNSGYCELLNSTPLYLADRIGELRGLDFLLLYFTDEAKPQAEKVIKAYKNGGTPPADYTRGLYYRELI